ncbi:MAG: hypothetical protein KGJ30_07895 [Burkholderiales bacterium]|nr:hypothetical protein [Burkholderiales bacterium]MDE1928376.1 hypothetical protein [Burkholderiales bacterium]MDE2158830.1 hypothetical protein [Burkholderiales bacterium]
MIRLASLHVAKTYAPDRNGAKKYSRRHGEALVCVRQRLSDDGKTRYTTIELLVETTPVAQRERSLVAIRIDPFDAATRSHLMACGARWDAKRRYWVISKLVARNLHLSDRIVPRDAEGMID